MYREKLDVISNPVHNVSLKALLVIFFFFLFHIVSPWTATNCIQPWNTQSLQELLRYPHTLSGTIHNYGMCPKQRTSHLDPEDPPLLWSTTSVRGDDAHVTLTWALTVNVLSNLQRPSSMCFTVCVSTLMVDCEKICQNRFALISWIKYFCDDLTLLFFASTLVVRVSLQGKAT